MGKAKEMGALEVSRITRRGMNFVGGVPGEVHHHSAGDHRRLATACEAVMPFLGDDVARATVALAILPDDFMFCIADRAIDKRSRRTLWSKYGELKFEPCISVCIVEALGT